MNIKPLLLIPAVASLVACGSNDSISGGDGTVSLLVTDNLTQDYSEVWVNIKSVSAINNTNQEVMLFKNLNGQTYNLSQLSNIGALVDTQNITADTYVSFEVEMENAIALVDQNSMITNATFDQSNNSDYDIHINGLLQVDANQNTSLLLDFDLQQFIYDAATNTVTPNVVQKAPSSLDQPTSTIFGEVESIISNNQFVPDLVGEGRRLNITLHDRATVTNSATREVLPDTSGLGVDMYVNEDDDEDFDSDSNIS